jgi:hypothetical protein
MVKGGSEAPTPGWTRRKNVGQRYGDGGDMMNRIERGSSPSEEGWKPWPRWGVRRLLGFASDVGKSTSASAMLNGGGTVISESGLTSHGWLERMEIVGNRAGAAGGGMDCLALALEEKRTVEIDPVLKKCRTMGLDKEVNLCIVIWGRRDKED